MPIQDWTEAELEDMAARVWAAVEYRGRGAAELRSVIEEIER